MLQEKLIASILSNIFFSYSINLQILNDLFEFMKGVGEIISTYLL